MPGEQRTKIHNIQKDNKLNFTEKNTDFNINV